MVLQLSQQSPRPPLFAFIVGIRLKDFQETIIELSPRRLHLWRVYREDIS